MVWISNAPDVTDISSEEKKQEIIDFFYDLVKTEHPNTNERKSAVHPCRIKLSEVGDEMKDLAQLLNRVQRHSKCSEGYCIRMNKKKKKKQCRFKFPKSLQVKTTLELNEKNEYELEFKRNDPLLNNYNPYIIQTWRANIDFSPVLSKQALINFLAKYISKPEKESQHLMDMLKNLLEKIDDDKYAKNIIQRLYIQCCSERDYSAQETCHLLNGFNLVCAGGRKFVKISFSPKNDWVFVPRDGRRKPRSIF